MWSGAGIDSSFGKGKNTFSDMNFSFSQLLLQCKTLVLCRCSVAQSCPTLLQHHGLQHARLPCPSPSPRVCSNSCPLSQCIVLPVSQGLIEGMVPGRLGGKKEKQASPVTRVL